VYIYMSVKKLIDFVHVFYFRSFFLMKNLFVGSLVLISMISGVLPANAQRVDYGGYTPPASAPAPQPVPSNSGLEKQVQDILTLNGLNQVACTVWGAAKLDIPHLRAITCVTPIPGKIESGTLYRFDQASNTINRVGAATVNNGPAGQATVGNPQVVPVQQPQVVPVATQQTDLEFALQTLQKNGMVNTVCTPETAQFFVGGKLTVCGNPTAQIGKGQYNINR
jgi:hypothetical protein